jgi:hypothetical protein
MVGSVLVNSINVGRESDDSSGLVRPSQYKGRSFSKESTGSAIIQFEKVVLEKDQPASSSVIGSIAITQDNNHKGWLHVLIYIGQLVNAIFTGHKRENINLCHSEMVIGINTSEKRKGELLLAHAIFGGIKTTSESHKKDEVITGVNLYRPVDQKLKALFEKYAKQTAVNFNEAGLNPRENDFKARFKKEVGQFSIASMISSIFHRQVIKPTEIAQRRAAYAAADLLRGDKLRNGKGELASFYCTGYVMTLAQGTALISGLNEAEQAVLNTKNRDEIASKLLTRIQENRAGDHLAAIYWNNEFMQMDASHTMSYAAGDVFDRASVS